ncbi:hypothetical protein ACFW04_009136 [Cataglyphis niger]
MKAMKRRKSPTGFKTRDVHANCAV